MTLDDSGTPTAMEGDWLFAPDSTAMVHVPDYAHSYFGWWMNEGEGSYGLQSFAGGAGLPAGMGNLEAAMEGPATYRGPAEGIWATVDTSGGQVTAAGSGEFTAEAVLTANFFAALDAGVVAGEIASFRDETGRSVAGWRVVLQSAGLTSGAPSFAAETSGEVGPGSSGEGSWEGRFHGTAGAETNARPSHVTGRFDLHCPGAHARCAIERR